MRVQRSWPLLLAAVGVGCATGQALDSSGNPLDYDAGSYGGDGSVSAGGASSTGGSVTTTGGYVSSAGGVTQTGGTAAGGRTSAGGRQATTGGANQGGSGGTLPNTGGRAANGGAGPTGGAVQAGGRAPTGGAAPTGGRAATGGASTDAGSCQSGQKMCGGVCSFPAPTNGCGLTGCTACPGPAPSGGVLSCNNTARTCDFVCLSGYTKQGSSCVSTTGNGGSGNGGGGGVGGAPGCNLSSCSNFCIPFYETRCCTPSGSCGCRVVVQSDCS